MKGARRAGKSSMRPGAVQLLHQMRLVQGRLTSNILERAEGSNYFAAGAVRSRAWWARKVTRPRFEDVFDRNRYDRLTMRYLESHDDRVKARYLNDCIRPINNAFSMASSPVYERRVGNYRMMLQNACYRSFPRDNQTTVP
jgi:hypothetical protein